MITGSNATIVSVQTQIIDAFQRLCLNESLTNDRAYGLGV